LHLAGILFPLTNDDSQSKSHQIYFLSFLLIIMNGFFLDKIQFLWLFKIKILCHMASNCYVCSYRRFGGACWYFQSSGFPKREARLFLI